LIQSKQSYPLSKSVTIAGGCGIAIIFCMLGSCFGFFTGLSVGSVLPTQTSSLVAETPVVEVINTVTSEAAPASTEISETPNASPIETLEPRAAFKAEVIEILGAGNRDVTRLESLNFNDPEEGAIFIEWAINDNLTEGFIKSGAKSDAFDILKSLAESGIDYTYVILSGTFPLQDQFGNAEEKHVVNLTFYKSTVAKINWENFLSDNIYNIADEAHIWAQFQDE